MSVGHFAKAFLTLRKRESNESVGNDGDTPVIIAITELDADCQLCICRVERCFCFAQFRVAYCCSAFVGRFYEVVLNSKYSGSMEPLVYRGDIMFLWRPNRPYRVGDITVYKLDGKDIPIVHRVIAEHTE
jgi:hypothetical protein